MSGNPVSSRSAALMLGTAACLALAAPAAAQQFDPTPAWPLCGRIAEAPPQGWQPADGCPSTRWGDPAYADTPFSSTFGPRPLASENNRYDFHRGMDLATPIGTPVFAIADGEVRTAGVHSSYDDPVIIVRHFRPGTNSCSGVGCYHALYLHMNGWEVAPGQNVVKGQLLGWTGQSQNGFEHLHFEIRDAPADDPFSSWQRDAIHPMTVLPNPGGGAPTVAFDSVDTGDANHPVVALTVTAPRYDVVRVELKLYDANGVEIVQPGNTADANGYHVEPSFFDLERWSFEYSHKDSSTVPWESFDLGGENECPYWADHGASYSAHVHMDRQHPDDFHVGQFNGVTVRTGKYWPGDYSLGLTFEALSGPMQCLDAIVTTADGATSTTSWGSCTGTPPDGGGGGKGGKGGGGGGSGGGGGGGKGKNK